MKIYKVKVNEKVYEVELMEVTENTGTITSSPTTKSTGPGFEIKSFIQGVVTDIHVSLNDKIEEGQPLISIEAMKMQNEIVSPQPGIVQQILVEKNEQVQNQQVIIVLG